MRCGRSRTRPRSPSRSLRPSTAWGRGAPRSTDTKSSKCWLTPKRRRRKNSEPASDFWPAVWPLQAATKGRLTIERDEQHAQESDPTMTQRTRWQYCQIETRTNDTGVLRQFFAERPPVETELHQNWPAMLAKLGEQGWELVSVVANEGGLGRRPLTYVLRRPLGTVSGGSGPTPVESS